MRARFRVTGLVWGSALLFSVAVFVAYGRSSGAPPSSNASSTMSPARPEDARLRAADFRNINTMTRVGDHFVTNVRGHLAEALTVARSAEGGTYPVGTIIQLVPQEAMVKRAKGFDPATDDWEFFSLAVSSTGTEVLTRGGAEVVNRFGGSCASCHSAAQSKFDLVCGHDHGCAPLPIGADVIASLQKADPRPRN